MVETGRVGIEKDVVTEHRTMDVPVTREEVYVERRPVDRRPSDQPIGEGSADVDVTVHEEEVTLEKRPVVYEEVAVGKRVTQDTERVEGEIRREVVDIDREGDVRIDGEPNPTDRKF